MKSIKIYGLLFLLSALLVCCNSGRKNNIQQVYKYGMKRDLQDKKQTNLDLSNKIEIPIEDVDDSPIIIDSIKVVKLCADMSTLMGTIDKVICVNDTLFVLDKLTNSLYIINSNGQIIKKIHQIGKAKHEFLKLGDFAIDTKKRNIILFDVQRKNFLYYNFNGDFVKAIKCPVWSKEFIQLNDGRFCLLTLGNNFSGYNVVLTDSLHRISGMALKTQSRYFLNFFGGSLVNYYSNDGVSFSYPFSNCVFSFCQDSLKLKYHVDFKHNGFPFSREKYKTFQVFKNETRNLNNTFFSLGSHIENTANALFEVSGYGKALTAIYSIQNKSTSTTQLMLKDAFIMTFPSFVHHDYFVSVIDAAWMIQYKQHLKKHYKLDSFFDDFTENNNPVLIYFKIKNV